MSLATWKKKYYPVEASKVSKRDALAHSIRKWRGLYPSVLKRYGLERTDNYISEMHGHMMFIDEESCALCRHFIDDTCMACPLAIARGGMPCDHMNARESRSPYGKWIDTGDSRMMLRWLRKAEKVKS